MMRKSAGGAISAIRRARGAFARKKRLLLCAVSLSLPVLLAAGMVFRSVDRRARLVVPPATLLFEDARGRFLAELSRDQHRMGFWPPPEPIPERIAKATLAAEDSRFYSHPGVDPPSVVRALVQDIRHMKRVSGASTIAMQVARLQSPEKRNLVNKALEALTAVALTERVGREKILRQYLTLAPYGNQNYGAAYAARRYFDKPLCDLTWAEAAVLASLPCMPRRMNVYTYNGWLVCQARAKHVLSRLRHLGWLNEGDYATAISQLPGVGLLPKETRPSSMLHAVLAIENICKQDPAFRQDRPIVRTTLDMEIQNAASVIASSAMKQFRADGAGNIAVIVARAGTGEVISYLGSEDYLDQRNKGAIDYARVPRSSGSTLKPFIYALGMSEKGFTAATLLTDVGLALNPRTGGYVIKNYDENYLGPILYRNALANSRNVPAVSVLESVGVETAYAQMAKLGLVRRWRDPRNYGLTLALGGLSVRLWDLVGAYGVLANEGNSCGLTWFPRGEKPVHPQQLIPEDVARQITLFLSDPMARLPSFPRMGWLEYPFPVAVKTGTSKNYRDAWCVAYSKKYIVGVWVGHPDYYGMKRRCGADSAAMVVHQIMATLHHDDMEGLSDLSFPPPKGYVAKRIDLLSGKLAREDTPYVALEWFKPGTEPVEETSVYRTVAIDGRTGLPAEETCPAAFRKEERIVVLDPKFDRWAKQSGLEVCLRPEDHPERFLKNLSPSLAVTYPKNGARFLPDPETPPEFATISLEASVEPPVEQVLWYVDGKPYEVADYPYSARWRIRPGAHTFRIGLPSAPLASPPVRITVAQ